MRTRTSLSPCLLALLVLLAGTVGAEEAWQQLDEGDGILVEGRPMPGTKLREIRVQAWSPLPPAAIFSVIWDVSAQHEFVPNVKELRVLRSAEEEVVIYERVKIPVVQDRDYVLRLTKKIDGPVHEVFAEGRSELGPPPPKNVVRMTRLSSHFLLRPSDGGTRLSYVSFGDPAGKIPEWIIRAADVKGPKDFVRAILRRAQEEALQRR